jgi:hypothetical protein
VVITYAVMAIMLAASSFFNMIILKDFVTGAILLVGAAICMIGSSILKEIRKK